MVISDSHGVSGKSKTSKHSKRGRKKKSVSIKVAEDKSKIKDSLLNNFNPNYLFDYLVSPIKSDSEIGIFQTQYLSIVEYVVIIETYIIHNIL